MFNESCLNEDELIFLNDPEDVDEANMKQKDHKSKMRDELAEYEKQLMKDIQGLQRESLQSELESFHSYSPS